MVYEPRRRTIRGSKTRATAADGPSGSNSAEPREKLPATRPDRLWPIRRVIRFAVWNQ